MTEEQVKALEAKLTALEENNEQLKVDLATEKDKSTKIFTENTTLRQELQNGKVEEKVDSKPFNNEEFLNAFFKGK